MSSSASRPISGNGANPILDGLIEELTEKDEQEVRALISEHVARTGSLVGRNILASWERGTRERFVKVMPRDYRRALEQEAAAVATAASEADERAAVAEA